MPRKNTSTAAAAAKKDDDQEEEEEEPPRKARLRQQLDSLHEEMEIAQYGKTQNGQARRKVSRTDSKVRTKKRRMLEKRDLAELAVEAPVPEKRLRGSRAAAEDHVIQGSMVIDKEKEPKDQESEEQEDDDELLSDEEEEDDEDDTAQVALASRPPSKASFSVSRGASSRPRRKKVFRMRNFRSARMAERHGEAMDAHIRGRPKEAIEKLKQVAKEAPSAPQVYFSLGGVYEDMLRECQRRQTDTTSEHAAGGGDGDVMDETSDAVLVPDSNLAEQLDLAKKAYGSYHVAAILCKKDYALWDHAADMASEIAGIHTSVMRLPDVSLAVREHHRSEKQRWLSEALSDYQTADNIKPPGIDVPAKLASVMMELGQLSEALTVLTDLKNRPSLEAEKRSDFESSYRAWWLYADLMLRIGYECIRWNQNIQENKNYMFRRWLRKHSKTFDWRERRLQSLIKALEAAAGSRACQKLLAWLTLRVQQGEKVRVSPEVDVAVVDNDNNKGSSQRFEKEKALLLEKSKTELAAFDKTTAEMSLAPGHASAKQRELARTNLVRRQKETLEELEGEFVQKPGDTESSKAPPSESNAEAAAETSNESEPLPPSASVESVCSIANELMRHVLWMKDYQGGRLVAEAVSSYFKERASMLEKRLEHNRKLDEAQAKLPPLLGTLDPESDNRGEMSDDGNDSDNYFSDEEMIEDGEGPIRLESLRAGALPPDLSVLYALSLVGEGGRDFLAGTCLKSIRLLEQEDESWLVNSELDTSVDDDHIWQRFRQAVTEPLGRTRAFALIVDVLRETGKEAKFSGGLAPLFAEQIEHMKKTLVHKVLFDPDDDGSGSEASFMRMIDFGFSFEYDRPKQVLSILTAAQRIRLETVPALVSSRKREEALSVVLPSLDTLTKMLRRLWRDRTAGVLPFRCEEILQSISRCFQILVTIDLDDKTVDQMIASVSFLCNSDSSKLSSSVTASLPDLTNLPILDTTWLSSELMTLSTRCDNLCISTNVSHFSGWMDQPFAFNLMRRYGPISMPTYFGIKVTNGRIAGLLRPQIEEEVDKQWEALEKVLRIESPIGFRKDLISVRSSPWYKEARSKETLALRKHKIAFFGEDAGLDIILAFSRACLLVAETSKRKERLVSMALSILIPISQFCLDKQLWSATVGTVNENDADVSRWLPLPVAGEPGEKKDDTPAPHKRPGFVKASKRAVAKQVKEDELPFGDWMELEDSNSPLSNVCVVPCGELLSVWKLADPSPPMREPRSVASCQAMQKLDECVRHLRACYTTTAVERASLQISAALIELLSLPDCWNPFVCLQQAASFASQGPKLGTTDLPFKAPLPPKLDCSPSEALAILGRAECMQALHFFPEAGFLCSYVASVCGLHRSNRSRWNERWKIVSILAYNTSVMIRHNFNVVHHGNDKKDDRFGSWEVDVTNEFGKARIDSQLWSSSLVGLATSDPKTSIPQEVETNGQDHMDSNGEESSPEMVAV